MRKVVYKKTEEDINKDLIRKWWLTDATKSVVDEDIVFFDLLEHKYNTMLRLLSVLHTDNDPVKDLMLNAIRCNKMRKAISNLPKLDDAKYKELIANYIMFVKASLGENGLDPSIMIFLTEEEQLKELVKKWWRLNPVFSTIDEDMSFDDAIETNLENILYLLGFYQERNVDAKKSFINALNKGDLESDMAVVQMMDLKNRLEYKNAFLETLKTGIGIEMGSHNVSLDGFIDELLKRVITIHIKL